MYFLFKKINIYKYSVFKYIRNKSEEDFCM